MNPHFIFNSLSVVQGMILHKEDKKAVSYLAKFSRLLRLILESSREKIVPLSKELEAIKNYTNLQNMSRKLQFKYILELDPAVDIENFMLPPMLIQPFVENAIEHGFKKDVPNPEITINITQENNQLVCEIIDNGIGIDATKEHSKLHNKSLATTITSERLKLLSKNKNAPSEITIEDRSKHNEKGTRVTLKIPFK
jgi:sensor histidine kinase YesM